MTNQKLTTNATLLLVDNGSTRVDAAVQLRRLAENISHETGHIIHAVSLKHSNRIPADDIESKLGGIPACVFTDFMTKQLKTGQRKFILIPLFFGNSRALTSFVPDEKKILEEQFGAFKLDIAKVLYPMPDGEPLLVDILFEHAISSAAVHTKNNLNNLVLVDHGSPLPAVNAVRRHIASALNARLSDDTHIAQAAMERREGKEYDFNGELLEDYLNRLAKSGETHATVLLLFLLAGTHAGENGDIVQICKAVMKRYPDFKVTISPLISQNKKIITCLTQRLNQLLDHLN